MVEISTTVSQAWFRRRTFHVPNLISLACVSSETHNLQAFFLPIYDAKGESWCQAFLAEAVEIRNKL